MVRVSWKVGPVPEGFRSRFVGSSSPILGWVPWVSVSQRGDPTGVDALSVIGLRMPP